MDLLVSLIKWLGANVITILGLTQGISKQAAHAAQETTPNLIQDNTHNTITDLESVVYGLFALHNQLTDIKAVVDTLSVTGVPITLPTVPPSGYGTPTTSDIGDAVWNYQYGPSGRQTGEWLNWAGTDVLKKWVESVTFAYGMYWLPVEPPLEDPGSYTQNFPTFNPGDLVAGESFLDCVTRQNAGMLSISQYYTNGPIYVATPITATLNQWVSTIDGFDYARMQALTFPLKESLAGPVWPGLAGVTLGIPVAIALGVTISMPMDGAIISLISVPAKQGSFSFDSLISWRNVGALAFVDDNGEAEMPQTLGFESAVYCPKSMAHAAGVVLRASSGVVGTITPWVVV